MQIVRSEMTVVNEVNHCCIADTIEMGVWGKGIAGLRENDLPTNSNIQSQPQHHPLQGSEDRSEVPSLANLKAPFGGISYMRKL